MSRQLLASSSRMHIRIMDQNCCPLIPTIEPTSGSGSISCPLESFQGFHRYLQFEPNSSSSSIEEVRSEFVNSLKQFTEAMDNVGPFFLGNDPSLVDFAMTPFVVRLWVFDEFKSGVGIPSESKAGGDAKTWSRWESWLTAITTRKSIRETTSERQHYVPIYRR